MNLTPTKLPGVFLIETIIRSDERGAFIKVFHHEVFTQAGIHFQPQESYYSISKKNVIRGMHFQLPPQDHAKLVYVTSGAITDVILDIRRGSPTFGQYITLELNETNRQAVYLPPGLAHGFLSHQENTSVTYVQSTMYSQDHDAGIRYDSFGYDWGVMAPIISARDQKFPGFADLVTPFKYAAS